MCNCHMVSITAVWCRTISGEVVAAALHAPKCEIVITTEFTQPMYKLTTLLATSYCGDGGSGYHMAVAHSYFY